MMKPNARFSYNKRWILNTVCLLGGDTLCLAFALVAAGLVRYFFRDIHIPTSRGFFLIPMWWVGAILLRLAPCWGIGSVEKLRREQFLLLGLFCLAAAAMFLSKSSEITSRIKFALAYIIGVPLIPIVRSWIIAILIDYKVWGIPTVIYGTDETVTNVLDIIRNEPGLGYQLVGFFDDETGTTLDIPRMGNLMDHTQSAPFALLGIPSIPKGKLQDLMDGSLSHYRRLILLPDLLNIPSVWVTARDFNGVLGLELVRNLLNPVARLFKRTVELGLIIVSSPFWIPLGILLALLIYLHDKKPPIYRQTRIGRFDKTFSILKFRSMVPDAEQVLAGALEDNEELRQEWNANNKLKTDPRITPLGRWLRRTSLDEIPQLLNVLKGEMALVGPRPLPQYHHDQIAPSVMRLRAMVAPGITGLWQVSGRSDVGGADMERLDTYYVRNWSIWLDMIIMAKTLSAVLRGDGAY